LTDEEIRKYRTGMICAVGSMTIWGFMPIYWRALIPMSSYVIILYRIALAGIASFAAALKAYGPGGLAAPLKQKGIVPKLFLTGLVITLNWNIYIYAVNSGQVIETCIGYYIDPLVVCAFGMIFFKERPSKHKLIAMILGCAGVLIVLLHFMRLPLIAIAIAITFASYTAIKKHLNVPAAISLFYETVFIGIAATALIIYLELNGKGAFAVGERHQIILLFFAGVLTAIPLIMFGVAANRVSMITIGIADYISPSITLLLGVFMFKEPFDMVQFGAFAVIWVGLVFFTFGESRAMREKN